MLVNRATRTSSAPTPPKLATPLDRETSPKRAPSVPLLPVVLLICCGLAASRLLPTSSYGPLLGPSSIAEDILPRPSPVELSLAEQTSGLSFDASLQPDVQVLLPAEVQCQSWCVTRAGATASLLNRPPKMDTCLSQCLAHPEVMTFLPALEASGALPSPTGRSLIFAAWYAEGERGAEGHDKDQLAKPDTSFISTLRRSHPGCTVAVLTDQATQLDLPADVRLFRFTIDRSKLGRNPYANYYQYLAQIAFMKQLMAEGVSNTTDVVFLDMDALVIDSITEVFGRGAPFDYGFSLSDATDMPINIGIQFVPRGRYNSAIAFLQDVLAIYPFNSTFTAGQEVLIDILGFNDKPEKVLAHVNASVQDGRTCLQVGSSTVCLFTCMRYNYCHVDQSCCTDPARLPLSLTSFDDLSAARVKVLHFVGHRKKALPLIHKAFMAGGAEGAYRALSMLPHAKSDYEGLDLAALERSLLNPAQPFSDL
ncbi:g6049 [Coccomyxa elongata]